MVGWRGGTGRQQVGEDGIVRALEGASFRDLEDTVAAAEEDEENSVPGYTGE